MLLFAALLAAAATTSCSDESSTSENRSKELIRNLRRQLVRDNSDYSLETSKKPDKIHMRAETEPELRDKSYTYNYYVTTIGNFRNKHQENVARNVGKTRLKNKAAHRISEKDLLYYIDDEKLKNKLETRKSIKSRRYDNTNVTSVTYKMLKVRHQYRRGQQNRYIQEEGEHGVAIVSVDKGPFPEVRLPRSRRQYKHDHGEAITDDEEIPPPRVDTSDPEAAVQDVENTELSTKNIAHNR